VLRKSIDEESRRRELEEVERELSKLGVVLSRFSRISS